MICLAYFLFFSSFVHGMPQNNVKINNKACKVKEVATGESKPCTTAFIIQNETYYGCTTENSPVKGKAWCSTKVDITYNHKGDDFYGFCPDDNSCLTHEQGKQIAETKTNRNTIDLCKTEEDCKCQLWSTCSWSSTMVDQIHILPINNIIHQQLSLQFQRQICDAQKKHVWCCRDGEQARGSELPILNAKANCVKEEPISCNSEEKQCGKWKPNSKSFECGVRTGSSSIFGGKLTKYGDYPYMALLGRASKSGFGIPSVVYTCGASLINKFYVLTAAHCFDKLDYANGVIEVVLGEHDTTTDPDGNPGDDNPKKITRKPAEIIIHEGYKSNTDSNFDDIALIRLDKAVPLADEDPSVSGVLPVCLPWSEKDPARLVGEGELTIATGWGAANNQILNVTSNFRKYGVSFPRLLQVQLPIANEKCSKSFNIDDRNQICAGGDDGKDSCNGDSGGPLVWTEVAGEPWTQIGLVSYGTKLCGRGVPGVYTRVDAYLDWIESKLKP